MGAIDFHAFKSQKGASAINVDTNLNSINTVISKSGSQQTNENQAFVNSEGSNGNVNNNSSYQSSESVQLETNNNSKGAANNQNLDSHLVENTKSSDLLKIPIENSTLQNVAPIGLSDLKAHVQNELTSPENQEKTDLNSDGIMLQIANTKTPRIASLLKSVKSDIVNHTLNITVSSKLHLVALEELRIELTQDLNRISNGTIKEFTLEMGEVEYTAKRPYTDKEKLDFLAEKHPKLNEAIEKLQLRLP